jgi:hypothetical protein
VELLTITVKEVSVRFVDTGGIVDHHCSRGDCSVCWYWWENPPVSTKRTITSLTVMVNNSTSINKTNNHLFNSDGQQFHQYQQNEQSPL